MYMYNTLSVSVTTKVYSNLCTYCINYTHACTQNWCIKFYAGCPANEATTDEAALTPQKIAKAEGYKDAMKELKKLTTFQDKAARGAKPKGFSEPWAVTVSSSDALIRLTTLTKSPLLEPRVRGDYELLLQPFVCIRT